MKLRLRILVDECLASGLLIRLLRNAGHDAIASVEVLGSGANDRDVFIYALKDKRAILTADCADFMRLQEREPEHCGLLLVYQDCDSRDMSYHDIVIAITMACADNPDGIDGHVIILNKLRVPKE